jgi:hypothetical protein
VAISNWYFQRLRDFVQVRYEVIKLGTFDHPPRAKVSECPEMAVIFEIRKFDVSAGK